jgi:hypothetical protein
MIDSTADKCKAWIPGVILLACYLIFYNMIGNKEALQNINYAGYIVTRFDYQIPLIPGFVLFYLFTVIYPLCGILYLINKADMSVQSFYRIYFTTLVLIGVCIVFWVRFPVEFV